MQPRCALVKETSEARGRACAGSPCPGRVHATPATRRRRSCCCAGSPRGSTSSRRRRAALADSRASRPGSLRGRSPWVVKAAAPLCRTQLCAAEPRARPANPPHTPCSVSRVSSPSLCFVWWRHPGLSVGATVGGSRAAKRDVSPTARATRPNGQVRARPQPHGSRHNALACFFRSSPADLHNRPEGYEAFSSVYRDGPSRGARPVGEPRRRAAHDHQPAFRGRAEHGA